MEVRVAKLAALLDAELLTTIFKREFLTSLSVDIRQLFPKLSKTSVTLIEATLQEDRGIKAFVNSLLAVNEPIESTPPSTSPLHTTRT